MDINLSLEHYDQFYKMALAAQEHAHFVPKCHKRVEELQQRCRVCSCKDDGTFVDLDAGQDFEFEPSICSYRELFQRTSLQFQFHTMPDLPSRICIRCGYKVKVFYLLTRQFVLGQHAMRSAITEWYHTKYKVEPPEQIEDRQRLMKQLASAEIDLEAKRKEAAQAVKPATPLSPIKDPIKALKRQRLSDRKRSLSADNRLNSDSTRSPKSPESPIRQRKHQMAHSQVNLRYPPKSRSPILKASTGTNANQAQPQRLQQSQTARAQMHRVETQKTVPNRVRTSGHRECIVSPRIARNEVRGKNNPPSNRMTLEATTATEGPLKLEVPPSKAQLQQKLQERRRQWR